MSVFMRAKFQIQNVERFVGGDKIKAFAVTAKPFDGNGISEDNTYAKFSPSGTLELTITNPALVGKIEPGQKFYLDFTIADVETPSCRYHGPMALNGDRWQCRNEQCKEERPAK